MKICISGLGRTGSQLAKYIINTNKADLVSAVCREGSPKVGCDLGEVIGYTNKNIPIYSSDNLEACILNTKPDVVIDFSNPQAALKNTKVFSEMNVKIVMGTTGFSEFEQAKIFSIATRNDNGMIYAPNITRGVNTLMFLTELASKILNNYDIEIVEMHHKKKLDSPSGTAIKIANNLRAVRNSSSGILNDNIPISSVRAGGIVGNHKVMLVGENDMIEITHQSFSRDAFAEGALYAAEFILNKVGVFEMKDAMNYKKILEEYLEYDSDYTENVL